MANFKEAERITGLNEGGYANNKSDSGGETYGGIARNYWSNWKGWPYIDQFKADYVKDKTKLSLAQWINASAKATPAVGELVSDFYKHNFWDVSKLDSINDQQLANAIYDFSVNSGTGRGAKFLQDSYNNVNGMGVDLVSDGQIGPKTLTSVNAFNAKLLFQEYQRLRELFYRKLAENPSQKQFLNSWLSRLSKYKDA